MKPTDYDFTLHDIISGICAIERAEREAEHDYPSLIEVEDFILNTVTRNIEVNLLVYYPDQPAPYSEQGYEYDLDSVLAAARIERI